MNAKTVSQISRIPGSPIRKIPLTMLWCLLGSSSGCAISYVMKVNVMTTHADEEADADDFTVLDVESAILTGEIVERQKESETGEWKYVISGEAIDGRPMSVVAKFGTSGRMLYILTVDAE